MLESLQTKGFSYSELLSVEGLYRLDDSFLSYLGRCNEALLASLLSLRSGTPLNGTAYSEWIIATAPILETFIAEWFDIQDAAQLLRAQTMIDDPIFAFKDYFVLREAKRNLKRLETEWLGVSFTEIDGWLTQQRAEHHLTEIDDELAVARLGQQWLQQPEQCRAQIEQLVQWCVLALGTEAGQARVTGWVSFKLPQRRDYATLVPTVTITDHGQERLQGEPAHWRERSGFQLTDMRMSRRDVMNEIHYCVYCHDKDGDFCSKGFPVKKGDPVQGLKTNPVGELLTGCPLEEKISEMHVLKRQGHGIAALATVMIDNPMCPATGHRICNDCMKACIYQKQDPVNIPEIETRVLTDVLSLPWGVEIYDLLVRWNPLRKQQWLPKPYNGKKILVMGMGPAGFTLAHHLLMEGFAVVGMEGLKVEALPDRMMTAPIEHFNELIESLDNRVMTGFGGVAEYGITVRWDKNFLKLIYMSLMRRPHFQVFGNVRFGGTLQVEDAWELGFDHLAIAVGAGLPRELVIPHSLAPGMRQANDFLMALQLTGAAKSSSLANLQVRLPAVVIGGGLTGIDTATEVQAYYIAQIEKMLSRYEQLVALQNETNVRARFIPEDLLILDEMLTHAREARALRAKALQQGEVPQYIPLLRRWGGVTVAYRKSMQESPAYCRNHEEVTKALEEGIYYAEGLDPVAVELDSQGYASALRCHVRVKDEMGQWKTSGEEKRLPARSIFVATGAKPNIAYEFEHRGTFLRQGLNYERFEVKSGHAELMTEKVHCKQENFGPFTSYDQEGYRVSFLGDTHPIFHGSVVKAIASAQRVYPKITALFQDQALQGDLEEYQQFREQMNQLFHAEVVCVRRHTSSVVELTVKAPMAARHFRPGQFFRIQNFERTARWVEQTRLQTEAIAALGIRSSSSSDELSFMIAERGVSSRLVATFQPGERIALMGPTGVRYRFPDEPATVMVVGGVMAMAHVRAIGPTLRANGGRVLFVGLLQDEVEFHCLEALQEAADAILWIRDHDGAIPSLRSQDGYVQGEVAQVLTDYAMGKLPEAWCPIPLETIDQAVIVGSGDFVKSIQKLRHGALQSFFKSHVTFTASVYGPMQCMLKGVCAQCLQWQVDPQTGQRTKAVYACSWHEQPMDWVDWDNLEERLIQNRVQETLSHLWLDYLLQTQG